MEEVDFLQDLVKRAKEADLFTLRWGVSVRLSNDSTFDTKPPDITNMSNYVCRHVNYHSSMIYCGILIVVGLDRQQPFYNVNNPLIQVVSISLCHVLYHHMNLDEGYSLIAEVHQESELDSADIVVPDIPEAEAMVSMINKQLSVYLSNYLVDAGMGKLFVKELIKGEIFPALNHSGGTCTWDSSKKKVATPEDAEQGWQQVLEARHGIKMNTVLT